MKKIAIIGASSGIGNKVASDFAAMGWQVAVAARREQPLRELQERYPQNIVYKTIDITDTNAVERFYDLIEMNNGIDVMLMASGIGFQDPELEISRETEILQTNVVGWARMMVAAYRYFARVSDITAGHIAAITSVASVKGIGIAAAYSASKRFQRNYIEALRQLAHTRHDNIDFTEIRPGFIRTPMLDETKDYPLMMSIDYAAPLIELAILRRQRVATVDWRWRLLSAAWSAIPSSWWTKMDLKF